MFILKNNYFLQKKQLAKELEIFNKRKELEIDSLKKKYEDENNKLSEKVHLFNSLKKKLIYRMFFSKTIIKNWKTPPSSPRRNFHKT